VKKKGLTNTEMRGIYAGWTCAGTNRCKTNPVAPGGFTECYHVNNYFSCLGHLLNSKCYGCDPHWGGTNLYCIGPTISTPCWKQVTSCGPAFEGLCSKMGGVEISYCQVIEMEPEPGRSCGDWDQCKNE